MNRIKIFLNASKLLGEFRNEGEMDTNPQVNYRSTRIQITQKLQNKNAGKLNATIQQRIPDKQHGKYIRTS